MCGHSYALIPGAVNLYQGSLCASRAFTYGLNYPWALSGQHGFSVNLNGNSFAAPAPSDNGYHFVPVALYEHSGSGWMVRGAVRGVLHVMEYLPIGSGFSTYTSVENVNGGLVLMARSAGQVYSASGPAYIYPASVVAFSLGDWA